MSRTQRVTDKLQSTFPIGEAVDCFDDAVRDTIAAVLLFVPFGGEEIIKRMRSAIEAMESGIIETESKNRQIRIAAYVKLDRANAGAERWGDSKLIPRFVQNQFVGLFSIFDAFLGELLKALFRSKPELCELIKREIKTSAVFQCESIDVLRERIINEYIDDIRRQSYSDQFAHLEQAFGLSLRKFDGWATFVESSQRRNLFTHCSGIVSEQYLKSCRDVGAKVAPEVKVGTPLSIEIPYLIEASRVVMEVGIKLGHTLWRKVVPETLSAADNHLSACIYKRLKAGDWKEAVCLGEFAFCQKKFSSEQMKMIITINYCIALCSGDMRSKSDEILKSLDLESSLPVFRLAKAVLLGQYKEASRIMKVIGRKGEIIEEASYHIWPLFREFRGTDDFQSAYEKIYGYPFVLEHQRAAEEQKKASLRSATAQEKDIAVTLGPGGRRLKRECSVAAQTKRRRT